jgi:hypothetical protein
MRKQLALIGAGVLIASGCFTYMPAEFGTVPAGDDVRVHLTRQGIANLPELPTQKGPTLTGKLLSTDGEQLRVRAPVALQQDGLVTRPLGQEVMIPAGEVLLIERRVFNRTRSSIAVGVGAVALAIAIASFHDSDPRTPETPERPREPEGQLRTFRFSFPVW